MDDRQILERIFRSAVAAVDPYRACLPHLEKVRERLQTGAFQRVVVAGFGKGALRMARAAEAILGPAISAGLVIVPHGSERTDLPQRIEVATASHPHPDTAGVAASRRIVELAAAADANTLFLLLVSGGGSALFTTPAPGITLEEKQETARLLMLAGADILELNTVRKHLSTVKGGQLARIAAPATVVALLLSDVVGDRPDVIASGPANPDPTTFADAQAVLEKYRLTDRVPQAVRQRLIDGAAGRIPETPKPGDPLFARVTTVIAAGNGTARTAAAAEAQALGLLVQVTEAPVTGEARVAGRMLADRARCQRARLAVDRGLCLVSGGETTVTVVGKGKGGRNQELALAFALEVAGEGGITLLSAGTDGIDGPTDAAGAIVDGATVARAGRGAMDPAARLAGNDAYPFLEKAGALFKCGPTGTNVMDLQLILVRRDQST
ncbi:glycerate kinase type-2 family protein [Geomesophilobacter sediminis]|uniref:Glycerate kinase n=1 Tax=Geomesophilobacter sediminis TaxID=2798584 RepID=A0A8J7LVL5_9BACT|nr:glycerate kinase [Geomesophilobacter sediminis]MBJ6725669.1 glycerate kinase [Geomesophilobacter sediminis]